MKRILILSFFVFFSIIVSAQLNQQTVFVSNNDSFTTVRVYVVNTSNDNVYDRYFPSTTTRNSDVFYLQNLNSTFGEVYNYSVQVNVSGDMQWISQRNNTMDYLGRSANYNQDILLNGKLNITDSGSPLNIMMDYQGISTVNIENVNTGIAPVVGSLIQMTNDLGYWSGLGMTNSKTTLQDGIFNNTQHLYNQGYAATLITVNGNQPILFNFDSSDSHSFNNFDTKIWMWPDGNLTSDGRVCDSVGCIPDSNLIHAEMWNYSSIGDVWTFPIASSGVYYNLTGLTTGDINGFDFTNADVEEGGSFLTANNAGFYKMSLSMSFSSSAQGGLFGVSVAHNWDEETHRDCYSRREAVGSVGNVGIECIMDLEVGDNVSIRVENENTNRNMLMHTVNLNLLKISDL